MKIKELFKDYKTVDLSDSRNLIPDWKAIREIPEFAVLDKTMQNTDFHKEGNVWKHTKLVGNAMYDIINGKLGYKKIPENPVVRMCLMAAAICHDLGKAGHTEYDEKDKQWHCNRHGFYGEQTVRDIFYDDNPLIRETVCALVKSHMIFHHLLDGGKVDKVRKKLIELSWSNVPISMHILLHLADCHGTVNDDMTPEKIKQHLHDITTAMYDNNVPADLPYRSVDTRFVNTRYREFLSGGDVIPEDVLLDRDPARMAVDPRYKPVLHMMIGLPGAGKDTYIMNTLLGNTDPRYTTVISRDKIREHMGINAEGEKNNGTRAQEDKVTEIFNARMAYAIENRHDIVVNNTNLTRKYRESYLIPALTAGYRVIYHVVEAPDLKESMCRREGQIPRKAIERMKSSFEFPTLRECDLIVIHKQHYDAEHELYTKDYFITRYTMTHDKTFSKDPVC